MPMIDGVLRYYLYDRGTNNNEVDKVVVDGGSVVCGWDRTFGPVFESDASDCDWIAGSFFCIVPATCVKGVVVVVGNNVCERS